MQTITKRECSAGKSVEGVDCVGGSVASAGRRLVPLLLMPTLVGAGLFSNFRGVAITKFSLRDVPGKSSPAAERLSSVEVYAFFHLRDKYMDGITVKWARI